VPENVTAKLDGIVDLQGRPIQSLGQFAAEWSASVEYRFVGEGELTSDELDVYRLWRSIAEAGGGLPPAVCEVRVSETMRPSIHEGLEPAGVWEGLTDRVIVHRRELRSVEAFAGTLLHELTHARSGTGDVTRQFESALTETIGRIAAMVCGPTRGSTNRAE
jgi:hypothetical protein